jgi:hypothetical protein
LVKSIRGQQVFVTRRVQANGHVYTIRNERGFVLTPMARERIANSETKGGQL